MRASGTFFPADLGATEAEVSRALADAGLPVAAARAWLASAAGRLQAVAQWSLDYDGELQVASFEVWKDGQLVFGLDDWLPSG
jgi:hypothetical protein